MKNLSFNKVVYLILICLLIQPAFGQESSIMLTNITDSGDNYAANSGKEKQQSFSFVYGTGINSISFDVSNNVSEDGSGHQLSADAIQLDNQGMQARVNVTAGETGSSGTADVFNQILGYTSNNQDMRHILELMPSTETDAHKPTVASNQNFWLSGKLKINGQLVKGNIVLGHNGDTSGNWWLGDRDGTRYDSVSNSGINVVGENDGQSYCINDSEANNEAVVTAGACNSYSPTQGNIVTSSITFSYGTKGITSVTFTPAESSDRQWYISEDGMGNVLPYDSVAYGSSYWYYNNKVSVSAGANGSLGTAGDFNNLLSSDVNSQMLHSLELMDRRQSEAHQLTLAQNMNFWLAGTLSINGNIVSSNFILGHNGMSDHNWWIGSPDGTRYDSRSNSGMNVQYVDGHNQTHTYCLNQSKNNYSLVVSDGVCTSKTYDERYHGHWKWVGSVTAVVAAIIYTGVCLGIYGEEDTSFCRPIKRIKRWRGETEDGANRYLLQVSTDNNGAPAIDREIKISEITVDPKDGSMSFYTGDGRTFKVTPKNDGTLNCIFEEVDKTKSPKPTIYDGTATELGSFSGETIIQYNLEGKSGFVKQFTVIMRENENFIVEST